MSEVKFGKSITLKQASTLIRTNPTTRFLLQGEPGIGKSSLLEDLAESLGYEYAYIDVPNMTWVTLRCPSLTMRQRPLGTIRMLGSNCMRASPSL